MSLSDFRTLGRSGLAVSPLTLGTMTFGTARWGLDTAGSKAVFDAYVEAGGNAVDTADVYSNGRSEEMLGSFIAERGLRDEIVLATKSGFATGQGPHAGGNGAKHLRAALDRSLVRLRTDYVDLYWVHVWDGVTPAEELLETMAGLVRAGKIRYWGISNSPAWFVAKIVTLATLRGRPGPIALQYFYSLVNRDIEDEHVPLAAEFGLGIVPWSPLAYGLLTGKYQCGQVQAATPRTAELPKDPAGDGDERPADDKRLNGANPFGDMLFTDRNWKIVDVVRDVAREMDEPSARVALAWVVERAGVSSTLIGVSRPHQLADSVAALELRLTPDQRAKLDAVSASAPPRMLYSLFTPMLRQQVVFGGSSVRRDSVI